MNWPTLRPGDEHSIVGESKYAAVLEELACGRHERGCKVQTVMAELVNEPTNKYDPDAVRVDVGGRTVGYVPKEETDNYRDVVALAWTQGRPATARATLTGGWQRPGDRGNIGLVLDVSETFSLRHPELPLPFLPFGPRLTVTKEEQYQTPLEAALSGHDRADVIAELRHESSVVTVLIGSQPVGQLTAAMSDRFAPLIDRVRNAGLPTTCTGSLKRRPKHIDLRLHVATPSSLFSDMDD